MRLILGGPGCGKTTRLMELVEDELARCEPDQIGFLAFTRKAAEEARERAMIKFGLNQKDLPYFRTLHSLAFHVLGLLPEEVMSARDYKELGGALGMVFETSDGENAGLQVGLSKSGRIAYLEQLARVQGWDLERVCQGVDYWEARKYADALAAFKQTRGLMDFTDMISGFCEHPDMPRFCALFIDEAQDLTPIHWIAVKQLMKRAERVYVAGDDDQAIYRWAGADVAQFLRLEATPEVLPISHRLPRKVFNIANNIAGRIRNRYAKDWQPRDDEGRVARYKEPDDVDLTEGSWMVLARNAYLLNPVVAVLRRRGLPYQHQGVSATDNKNVQAIFAWEKLRRGQPVNARQLKTVLSKLRPELLNPARKVLADDVDYTMDDLRHSVLLGDHDWMTALVMPDAERDYYRAVRRRGESLTNAPRIVLSSIHASKGGEADNVLLLSDMSTGSYRDFVQQRDDECRVFYVGVTRARKSLHILYPKTNKFFPLLRE